MNLTDAMYKVLGLPENLAFVAGTGPNADWATGNNMPAGYDLNCTGCIHHGIRRDTWLALGGVTFEQSLAQHIEARHALDGAA